MKRKHRFLSLLLATAVLAACLGTPALAAQAPLTVPVKDGALTLLPTPTPVPFPENVTPTPKITTGKYTLGPFKPTATPTPSPSKPTITPIAPTDTPTKRTPPPPTPTTALSKTTSRPYGPTFLPLSPIPTGLTGEALIPFNHIRLQWDSVLLAEKYYVYRSSAADLPFERIGEASSDWPVFYDEEDKGPDTEWYYKVSAVVRGFERAKCDWAYVKTLSAAPQGLTARTLSSHQIEIRWQAVPGADYYAICRMTPTAEVGGIVYTTACIDDGLTPDTLYEYDVRAVNNGIWQLSTGRVSARTLLPAPSGLTLTPLGPNRIQLTWSPVIGADAYNIYRSDTGDIYAFQAQAAGTVFISRGLSPNTYHSYKIAAVNEYGEGELSEPAETRTRLPSPTGLKVTALNSSGAWLYWNAVPDASEYTVYRSLTPYGGYAQVGHSTSPSFSDTGLEGGAAYYYIVSAVNAYGEGGMSTAASVRIPLAAPQNLTAIPLGSDRIQLSWSAVAGATGYNVYRSDTGDLYARIKQTAGTSWTDADLPPNSFHYYEVSAYNAYSEGYVSAPVSARTGP